MWSPARRAWPLRHGGWRPAGGKHRHRWSDGSNSGPTGPAQHVAARLRPADRLWRHLRIRHPRTNHPAFNCLGAAGRRDVLRFPEGPAGYGHFFSADRFGRGSVRGIHSSRADAGRAVRDLPAVHCLEKPRTPALEPSGLRSARDWNTRSVGRTGCPAGLDRHRARGHPGGICHADGSGFAGRSRQPLACAARRACDSRHVARCRCRTPRASPAWCFWC